MNKLLSNYKQQIVPKGGLKSLVESLKQDDKYIGIDTETYGLSIKDRMFSLQLAGRGVAYYINFNGLPDHLGILPPSEMVHSYTDLDDLGNLFSDPSIMWCSHNAKFELHKLADFGITLNGGVHCTYAMERILKNNLMGYSLADCAKRRGWEKDKSVDVYIAKHGLTTRVSIPHKKKRVTDKHFDQVPFGIMAKYGLIDAILHREIARDQVRRINAVN